MTVTPFGDRSGATKAGAGVVGVRSRAAEAGHDVVVQAVGGAR